jgi:hypothetical protein
VCHIRLTRKLAATLNGLNVSNVSVGEVIVVSDADAAMMVAEGWAEPISTSDGPSGDPGRVVVASDRSRTGPK